MSCAFLDRLREYYYHNRTRLNVLRMLLKKDDITLVAGHSGANFEILANDIPVSAFPAELFTEVTGYFCFTIIALSMMLSINWQVTIFIFIPLSAAIYFIQCFTERIREKRHASRAAQDAASSFTADVVDMAIAIKASGAVKSILKRFDEVNRNRRAAFLIDALFGSKINFLLNIAVHAGSAIMMFAAARLMTGGSFGLGDFSLFIAHLGTLADCVNRIVELVTESRKAEVSFERIMKAAGTDNARAITVDPGITLRKKSGNAAAINHPGSLPDFIRLRHSPEPLQSFEVKNLSFEFDEGKGFRNVSFSLEPGELMVVTGKIGSGKSTLAGVLTGTLPHINGTIFINGKSYEPDKRRSAGIAAALQRGGFFSGTLRENICLGLSLSDDELHKALFIAALDDLANDLDMDIGSRGSRLSGGQQ